MSMPTRGPANGITPEYSYHREEFELGKRRFAGALSNTYLLALSNSIVL